MTRRLDELDGLRVKTACATDWSAMTGDDRKRHCETCDKQVYDLSRMTRPEIERLVRITRGNFCGRMTRHADGRVFSVGDLPVSSPPSSGFIKLRRASPVAAAALGLAVGLSGIQTARAQDGRLTATRGQKKSAEPDAVQYTDTSTAMVQGTCLTAEGRPVAGVVVTMIEGSSGEYRRVTTAEDGRFLFENLEPGTYRLFGKHENFYLDSKKIVLGPGMFLRTTFPITRSVIHLSGAMGGGGRSQGTLVSLFRGSELIVDARMVALSRIPDEEETTWKTYSASFLVDSVIKGSLVTKTVSVNFEVFEGDTLPYVAGTRYLLFLSSHEDKETFGSDLEVSETDFEFQSLRTAMSDLRQLSAGKPSVEEVTEWLVRAVEQPETRSRASADLAEMIQDAEFEKKCNADQARKGSEAVEAPPAERTEDNSGESPELPPDPLDLKLPDPGALTRGQRERLAGVLFGIDELREGDISLVRIVRGFDDPKFVPFVLANLKRMRLEPNPATEELVDLLSEMPEMKRLEDLAALYQEATWSNSGLALATLGIENKPETTDADTARKVEIKLTLSDEHAFILAAILREAETPRAGASEAAGVTVER